MSTIAALADNLNASAGSASVTKNEAGSEDRFLKLLVAQLNNQDPMNPMDNAQMTSQMAQISTVSGVQQVNQTLQGLASQLAALQMLQGGSLVGQAFALHHDAGAADPERTPSLLRPAQRRTPGVIEQRGDDQQPGRGEKPADGVQAPLGTGCDPAEHQATSSSSWAKRL